jgi:hypothetical protein
MKMHNEIVDGVRTAREAYAARFNFDLRKILDDLKKKEATHQQDLAPLRPAAPKKRRKLTDGGPMLTAG